MSGTPPTSVRRGHVVAAFDKFRSSAAARELNDVVARAARARSLECDAVLVSDGGEGFAATFDGEVVTAASLGALGDARDAPLTLVRTGAGEAAVIETASVVGRDLLENPSGEQALAASSDGVGLLILAAARLGVSGVVVGCGGTSTSDAGRGCYRVLREAGGLPIPVTVATDVRTTFLGARRYARQKGVREEDLRLIDERLDEARRLYQREGGLDVEALERTGAAGGIAGALAALGASLTSGFEEAARAARLDERLDGAALVVTGEGRLDAGSLEGKVVLGVAEHVAQESALLIICGSVETRAAAALRAHYTHASIVSLEERWPERGLVEPLACVEIVVAEALDELARSEGRR